MTYSLDQSNAGRSKREPFLVSLKRFLPLAAPERRRIVLALCATLVTSASALTAPLVIARTVDTYIARGVETGVIRWAGVLLVFYLFGLVATYVQMRTMGEVGRRIVFNLRNTLFEKLQQLPIAFFNQNRSGDLISRLNSDTDRLHYFSAYALIQLASSAVMLVGAAVLVVALHPALGFAALGPGAGVFIISQPISKWIKQRSLESMRTLGGLSGEVQESLVNFKVMAAFNRSDYFQKKLRVANEKNFSASTRAGITSSILAPLYGFGGNLGLLIVMVFGVWFVARGSMTTGLLIGYVLYVNSFYQAFSQLAAVWSSFQIAFASLDRIAQLLSLESNLVILQAEQTSSTAVMEFRNVSFGYTQPAKVLHDVNFALECGKTYALVGPTGGGKTTTAFLMARLYDPQEGRVLLGGRDIRSYSPADRARRVGFILQEPFLFTGTVGDNVVYGNPDYRGCSRETLESALHGLALAPLLSRFEVGLDTEVASDAESMSLGQKQLIAFLRAVLRRPELLILDEATANVDTVTEQLLESILVRLPVETTKVVIAHRLNTIKKADEILFVNSGKVIRAGSLQHAMDMLSQDRIAS